jgi:hypothetical protein
LQDQILAGTPGLAAFDGVDNSLVIGSDKKMSVGKTSMDCKQETEFYRDELGPPNVSSIGVPSGGEYPRVPYPVENDTNSP